MSASTLPSRWTRAPVPSRRYRRAEAPNRHVDLAPLGDPDAPKEVRLYRKQRRVYPARWYTDGWGTTGWIGYGCWIVAVLFVAGCTLPGYQGGPMPRPTQYTYPGQAWNPETRLPHSPVAVVAEPIDGGVFVFGLVFHDGSTATSVTQHESLALCERERAEYAGVVTERVKEGGATVMTVRCHRAHETGVMHSR